jgi:hypothetical protein
MTPLHLRSALLDPRTAKQPQPATRPANYTRSHGARATVTAEPRRAADTGLRSQTGGACAARTAARVDLVAKRTSVLSAQPSAHNSAQPLRGQRVIADGAALSS